MSGSNQTCAQRFSLAVAAALLLTAENGATLSAGDRSGTTAVPVLSAKVLGHFPAADAFQGAAVDERSFYAIASRSITRYDKASGSEQAHWSDRDGTVTHLNSCTIGDRLLVCAASNYPDKPAESTVELFDPATLVHLGRRNLGHTGGWLAWADRHDGTWWLCIAHYGANAPLTTIAEYDDDWRRRAAWRLPGSAIRALAPMSASGGAWGDDGLLYVMGHDRPDLLALRLPRSGTLLRHVATIRVGGGGQAFGWDPARPRVLFSIDRGSREIVVSKIPPVPDPELSGFGKLPIR